jgi:2-polyprenyl-6-methoxyphenol hydroxylase-like FAD-dependent oxidoreductase
VDRHGHKSGGFPVYNFFRVTNGRYTELRRSDLAATIYGSLDGNVETVFGDSVARIEDEVNCVRVDFDHAASREADLVIGADGLHSRVRTLAFGPEEKFEVPLGYHVAAFEVQGYRPRDELVAVSHSVPGRQITRLSLRDDKTLFLFVFRDEYLTTENLSGGQELKSALKDVYADAAACVSLLAGEGTGLAMAEAYVLAGELHACRGDYIAAFARYQERMMPFLKNKQESVVKFASSFAPKSDFAITIRDNVTRLLRIPFIANYLVGRELHDDIKLPDYSF